MRSFLTKATAVAALLLLAGVSLFAMGTRGDGNIKTETRSVSGFDSIDASGAGKVYVTQGAEFKVVVKCDANLIDRVRTEVKGGSLHLWIESGWMDSCMPTLLEYEVTLPKISHVGLSGAIDAITRTPLRSAAFRIEVSGSGSFQGILSVASSLAVSVSGSGSIRVEGDASSLDADVSGAGSVRAAKLAVATAEASVSGSGFIELAASKRLKANVSGSGEVRYTGDPEVDESVSGSGFVGKM